MRQKWHSGYLFLTYSLVAFFALVKGFQVACVNVQTPHCSAEKEVDGSVTGRIRMWRSRGSHLPWALTHLVSV